MSVRGKTYVIFDGDKDMWAYKFMRGWKINAYMSFDFDDAHDLKPITYRATDETYIKSILRQRMIQADQVIVLVGESTKYLYRYVRWEIELALKLNKPIIVVNLNNTIGIDKERCPAILKSEGAIHVPFKAKIIEHSMNDFPIFYSRLNSSERRGDFTYPISLYKKLNLL